MEAKRERRRRYEFANLNERLLEQGYGTDETTNGETTTTPLPSILCALFVHEFYEDEKEDDDVATVEFRDERYSDKSAFRSSFMSSPHIALDAAKLLPAVKARIKEGKSQHSAADHFFAFHDRVFLAHVDKPSSDVNDYPDDGFRYARRPTVISILVSSSCEQVVKVPAVGLVLRGAVKELNSWRKENVLSSTFDENMILRKVREVAEEEQRNGERRRRGHLTAAERREAAVVEQMLKNIDDIISRGDRIEDLLAPTEHLGLPALNFEDQSREMQEERRYSTFRLYKMTRIGFAIVVVGWFSIVLLLACGGFTFHKCSAAAS